MDMIMEDTMDILNIFKNEVFIVALAAGLVAQFIKMVIHVIVNKQFSLERLTGDGGMPSGHSATVTAAALMVGILEGFASPVFGLALIFAIVVMRDAAGVRYETGKHANRIMEIVELVNQCVDYMAEFNHKLRAEKLKTLVGHTKLQVFFGAVTGVCVVLFYLWIQH